MIIFLNGTSSSGKSSIAKELLKKLNEPYFYFSVDSFLEPSMPPKINRQETNGSLAPQRLSFIQCRIVLSPSEAASIIIEQLHTGISLQATANK